MTTRFNAAATAFSPYLLIQLRQPLTALKRALRGDPFLSVWID
jgi:hypothetical protein